MGYQIDIAFDMRVVGSVTCLWDELVRKSEENNCEMHYINYEVEGVGRTVRRNHAVMTFIFPSDPTYIIKFIRFVKEFKDSYIESISCDDHKCVLIYASKKYLSMMDSDCAKRYRKSRHLLSTEHKSIINAF